MATDAPEENTASTYKPKFKVLKSNCSASEIEALLNSGYIVDATIDFPNNEHAFIVMNSQPDKADCAGVQTPQRTTG